MQEKIHKELKELEIDHAPSNLKYKEKNIDVWLQPTYVWEIKAADLSISPVYVAALGEIEPERGIALRFPRFIRERGDKRVDEATNNEQLLELYKAQAAVNIDFGANDDFDFWLWIRLKSLTKLKINCNFTHIFSYIEGWLSDCFLNVLLDCFSSYFWESVLMGIPPSACKSSGS